METESRTADSGSEDQEIVQDGEDFLPEELLTDDLLFRSPTPEANFQEKLISAGEDPKHLRKRHLDFKNEELISPRDLKRGPVKVAVLHKRNENQALLV